MRGGSESVFAIDLLKVLKDIRQNVLSGGTTQEILVQPVTEICDFTVLRSIRTATPLQPIHTSLLHIYDSLLESYGLVIVSMLFVGTNFGPNSSRKITMSPYAISFSSVAGIRKLHFSHRTVDPIRR